MDGKVSYWLNARALASVAAVTAHWRRCPAPYAVASGLCASQRFFWAGSGCSSEHVRHQEDDLGAVAGAAADRDLAPDGIGTFPHADQSPVPPIRTDVRLDDEPPAVVDHRQAHPS